MIAADRIALQPMIEELVQRFSCAALSRMPAEKPLGPVRSGGAQRPVVEPIAPGPARRIGQPFRHGQGWTRAVALSQRLPERAEDLEGTTRARLHRIGFGERTPAEA